jgi:alpha-L-rhamnosidase
VPGGDIKWARTTYKSIRGDIAVSWKIDGGSFLMDVTIPANATATVFIPTSVPDSLGEMSTPIKDVEGVTYGGAVDGGARMVVRSGSYHFSAAAP